MDFLKNSKFWKKTLFIGALLCVISFGGWRGLAWWTRKEWVQIPVKYTEYTAVPTIPVKIEDIEYDFLLDTGYTGCFSMKKRALEAHSKEFRRSEERMHFGGAVRMADVYVLPQVLISTVIARNFEMIEEPDGREGDTPLVFDFRENKEERLEQTIGKVGAGFLTAFANGVFLDLQNSVVYFNADFAQLRKEGYSLEDLVSASIGMKSCEGITFWVETDWGKKRFVLDTGCTKSVIRKESLSGDAVSKEWGQNVPAYYSSQFSIQGKDFGEQSFLIFQFSPEITDIDGVLGMDFLKKHIVHLDFANRTAYFGDSQKKSKK